MRLGVRYLYALVLLSFVECIYYVSEHSLPGPYDEDNPGWVLDGSKYFIDHIQLNSAAPNDQGSIWNVVPCQLTYWELQIAFSIQGEAEGSFGNGMAIWYVKEPAVTGPVFGSKNFFSGLGVFIDTFEDPENPHQHRHPYISAMVNNGSLSYGHDEEGTFFEIGGCQAPVRNREHILRMAVSYSSETLAVFLDIDGLNAWVPCFTSYGVHLPTGYFFGITANTGKIPDDYRIFAVTTLGLSPPEQVVAERANIIPWAENFRDPNAPYDDGEEDIQYDTGEDANVVKRSDPTPEPELKQEPESEMKLQPEPKPKAHPEPKPKAHPEPKPKAQPEPKPKPQSEPKPKTQSESKAKANQQKKPESVKKEKIVEGKTRQRSWLYTIFIVVIVAVAAIYGLKWCNQYRARRKEVMQKRLY